MAATNDVEPELVGLGDAPTASPAGGGLRLGPLGVVLLLLAGIVAVTLLDDTGDGAPPTTTDPPAVEEPTADASTAGATSRDAAAFPAVRLLPAAASLEGRLAVTTSWRAPGAEPIWIVDRTRLTGRSDVPVFPGGWRYPLLFAGERVVFPSVVGVGGPDDRAIADEATDAAGGRGLAALPTDGSAVELLQVAEPGDELIAGSRPGEVWSVRSLPSAPLVYVTALAPPGSAAEEAGPALLDGMRGVWAGVADGVVGHVGNGASSAAVHWSAETGLRPLTSVTDPGTIALAAAGDLLAVYEPARPGATVIDVRSDDRVAELAISFPLHACFSPDGRYLALAGSRGPDHVDIVEVAAPDAVPGTLRTEGDVVDLTWTAAEQAIVITEGAIVAVGAPSMRATTVAELQGATEWSVTSDAATC